MAAPDALQMATPPAGGPSEGQWAAARGSRANAVSRIPVQGGGLWNPCCSCLFSPLPDDMMVNVMFAFLGPHDLVTASQVCRRWRHVSTQDSLWRSAETRALGIRSGKQLTSFAQSRGRALRSLSVGRELLLAPAELAELGNLLPRLQTLRLADAESTTSASLAALLESLPHLREADLSGAAGVDTAVLRALGSLPSLRRARLAQCVEVTPQALEQFATSPAAQRLQMLDVGGVPALIPAAVVAAARRMPQLRELYCGRAVPWTRKAFVALFAPVRAFCNGRRHAPLRAVDVGAADPLVEGNGVDGEALVAAARQPRFRGLCALRLAGTLHADSSAWQAALGAARHLVELDVRDCTGVDDAVLAAAGRHHAHTLRLVRLDGCTSVTENGVRELRRVLASSARVILRDASAWPALG